MTIDVGALDKNSATLRELMLKQTSSSKLLADLVGPANAFSDIVAKSMRQDSAFANLVKLKVFDVSVKPDWVNLALIGPKTTVMHDYAKLAATPKWPFMAGSPEWSKLIRAAKGPAFPPGFAELIAGKGLLHLQTTKTAAFAAAVARQWESGALTVPSVVSTPVSTPMPASAAKPAQSLPKLTRKQALEILSFGSSLLTFAVFLETPDLRHWMCVAGVLMIAAAIVFLTES